MKTKKLDDERIRQAKEKLACKIEPPAVHAAKKAAREAAAAESGSCETSGSCSISGSDGSPGIYGEDGRIRLTQMTTAGG